MKHEAYERIHKDAKVAVLFIHGIVGTPNHFRDFVKVVPEEMSVVNMLLDGHGKKVEDFSRTSMKKWRAQVEETVNRLIESHDAVMIAAHSMGTLFAIDQAIKHPDKVQRLFLLAAPVKLFLKPAMVSRAFRVYRDKIKPADFQTLAAKDAYSMEKEARLWKYIGWAPRFLELFQQIRYTRKHLPLLQTSCHCFQSKKDEMVSVGSIKILEKNPFIHLTALEQSTHFYYHPDDYSLLIEAFERILV